MTKITTESDQSHAWTRVDAVMKEIVARHAETGRARRIGQVLRACTSLPEARIASFQDEANRAALCAYLENLCERMAQRGATGHWSYSPAWHKSARRLLLEELEALE